jgi:hypothetical protein
MAQITHAIVSHLAARLESLALDDPSVSPRLRHDPTLDPDAAAGLEQTFRRFVLRFPSRVEPTPQHVGTAEYHPRLWRLPLSLEVLYPWGAPGNRMIVSGIALDDAARIVHHLEVDHTRQTVAGAYEWSGVLVTHEGIDEREDHLVSLFAIEAIFQRAF